MALPAITSISPSGGNIRIPAHNAKRPRSICLRVYRIGAYPLCKVFPQFRPFDTVGQTTSKWNVEKMGGLDALLWLKTTESWYD